METTARPAAVLEVGARDWAHLRVWAEINELDEGAPDVCAQEGVEMLLRRSVLHGGGPIQWEGPLAGGANRFGASQLTREALAKAAARRSTPRGGANESNAHAPMDTWLRVSGCCMGSIMLGAALGVFASIGAAVSGFAVLVASGTYARVLSSSAASEIEASFRLRKLELPARRSMATWRQAESAPDDLCNSVRTPSQNGRR